MKEPVEIERLLQWAYRHELPKRKTFGPLAVRSAWHAVDNYARLGCRVDTSRSISEWSAPHGDALIVADEVLRLRTRVGVNWHQSKRFLLGDLYKLAPMDLNISLNEAELIRDHACQGVSPDWCRQQPRASGAIGKNGKPQVCGTRYGKSRYSEGAHCPLQWGNPSIESIAITRAAYAVWHRCLDRLTNTLNEKLKHYSATPPTAPAAPWAISLQH